MRIEVLFFHKSIGVTVLGLIALRIVWRLIAGAPEYVEPLGRLTHAAARAGHLALYALMIAMPVSGYLTSTAGGQEVSWFGLFSLPSLVAKDKVLAETTSWAHLVFAWAIAIVLAAHLGAVVWHAVHQARLGIDAHVAELSTRLRDREIVMGAAFRSPQRTPALL